MGGLDGVDKSEHLANQECLDTVESLVTQVGLDGVERVDIVVLLDILE